MRLLALTLAGVLSLTHSSFAQETEETPLTKWIEAEEALLDGKSRKEQQTYYILRTKYGLIRTIEVVEADIEKAVKACGRENPDLKQKMDGRFSNWQDSVKPVLNDAATVLNKEINEQNVIGQSAFKDILELNDKAFEFQESQIEKNILTTEKACLDLLESMDRTEDKMIDLLQDILLPENVIRERAERNAEAQKEE